MPTVSVIVPNYNHAQYLKQRIESILNQTYQHFELILLDDCSTDNSHEVLLSYKDHPKVSNCVINTKNSGSPFKQWNRGIALARGEYVWIAESDDWAEPEFLEHMVAEIKQHPNVGLAYALARYQFNDTEPWELQPSDKVQIFPGNKFIREKLLFTNVVYNVSMTVFKRAVFQNIQHTLYERMHLCGDWFFYVLLCQKTDVLAYDKILSNYRMHDSNTSSKAEKLGKSFLEGVDILNYIIQYDKKIKTLDYAFFWAKQWVKYRVKFNISKETNRAIFRKMYPKHTLIILMYYIYNFYYFFKIKYS
jgi:glycosyltransferase involved in cell wall biosynthesis